MSTVDCMTTVDARAWLAELAIVFERERENLGRLDALVGDGDHGASMARGFAKANEAVAGSENAAATVLTVAGRAFMKGVGGASGPLFATVLLELGKSARESGSFDLGAIQQGVQNALARIQSLGRAKVGDKTMVDVLAPVALELGNSVQQGAELTEALAAAATVADAAAEATAALPARQGRARYIEGKGEGQADPGATSMALVFKALARVVQGSGA